MIDVGKKYCTCDATAWDGKPVLEDFGEVLGEQTSLLASLPFNLCTALFGIFSLSFPLAVLTVYIQIAS